MDNNGGGPLGVTELLMHTTTVASYLKDDWFRDWGALQRLTPYYPTPSPRTCSWEPSRAAVCGTRTAAPGLALAGNVANTP